MFRFKDGSNILKDIDLILEADKIHRINESRNNIFAFVETCMTDEVGEPWKLARHHKEWYTLLLNNNIKKLQIMAARLHAKTETLSASILYAIGKNPNLCIKYVSGDDDLAIDIVSKISRNIKDNSLYREIFPHVIPDPNGEWSKHSIFIKRSAGLGLKDATIEARGVFSSGTGGRCHWLILDDVIDARVLREPARIAAIKNIVESDWINLLWPGGRIFLIGTPWSFEPPDLNVEYSWGADVRINAFPANDLKYLSSISSNKWVLWKGPATNGSIAVPGVPLDGEPLWPEKWSLEALEERRSLTNNDVQYNQQFMLEGMIGKSDWFKEEWLQKCIDKEIKLGEGVGQGWPIYMGVDPARSLASKSSNSCIFVIAVSPSGKRIPLEIFVGKLESNDLAQKIIEMYLHWKPIVIMVENNGYQQALIELTNVLSASMGGIILPIKGQYTGSQKWSPDRGLPKIGAELSAGMWVIPRGGEHDNCSISPCGSCLWLREMRKYGKEKSTSDTIMAMWLADCAVESTAIFGELDSMAVIRTRGM